MNLLLGVLDDGRLTDSKGRTVSFANTVIIMTSNIGAHILLEKGSTPESKAMVMELCRKHFRPEFLNRIDEIVQFDPLSPGMLRGVARLQSADLNARLKEKNIELSFTDGALDFAVSQSYDHAFGARPLRRWLEHSVVTPLSRMIITGKLQEDSKVVVDHRPGADALSFAVTRDEIAAAARAAAAERSNTLKKMRVEEPDDDSDEEMED